MFRHVVLLTFKDETTTQDVRGISESLNALAARLPGVRAYNTGTDVGLGEQNSHFAIVGDFDDIAAYVAYRDHPEHERIITELVRPQVASRAAAQYEF
jgi:hypothetical protein